MSRPNPAFLAVFLGWIALITALFGILKGGLYVSKFEGDTLHFTDLLLRLASGERIHQDFMTPIGILAAWPVTLFNSLGFNFGMSFLLAQGLIAVCLAPAVWYVCQSRLSRNWAYFYGAATLIMVTAVSHGTGEMTTSMSMHYNRWAWALTFLVIPILLLPPLDAPRARLDGVILGLAMSVLALLKATYFVALMPAILLVLLVDRRMTTLAVAALVGAISAAATVLFGGMGFVEGYVSDLIAVSQSEVRSFPGLPLGALVVSPPYFGGVLAMLAGLVFLRQSGRMTQGLAVMVLLPGLIYITYQNFGNDRVWLLPMGVCLWMLRPAAGTLNTRGWDLRFALSLTAMAALVTTAPSFHNLLTSPMRHLGAPDALYMSFVPGDPLLADIYVPLDRSQDVLTMTRGTQGDVDAATINKAFGSFEVLSVAGQKFEPCTVNSGIPIWMEAISSEMRAANMLDAPIFMADALNLFPHYSEAPSLRGGSPWYYGGLRGLEDATYLAVPHCALSLGTRNAIIKEINAADLDLAPRLNTEWVVVFEVLGKS